jgi:hypothetical protein
MDKERTSYKTGIKVVWKINNQRELNGWQAIRIGSPILNIVSIASVGEMSWRNVQSM